MTTRKAKPKAKDTALLAGLRIRVGLLTKQLALVRSNLEDEQLRSQRRLEAIDELKQRVRDEAAARRKMEKVAGGVDGIGAEELTKARAAYEAVSMENAALRAQLATALKDTRRAELDSKVARVNGIRQRTLLRTLRDRVETVDDKYAMALALLVDSKVEIDDDMKAALDELDEG